MSWVGVPAQDSRYRSTGLVLTAPLDLWTVPKEEEQEKMKEALISTFLQG